MHTRAILIGVLFGLMAAAGRWWLEPTAAREGATDAVDGLLSDGAGDGSRPAPEGPPLAGHEAVEGTERAALATPDAAPDSQSDFGTVALGRVVDTDGAPVSECSVELVGEGDVRHRAWTGSGNGWSRFDVEAGSYALHVRAAGHRDLVEVVEIPDVPTWSHLAVLSDSESIPVRFETLAGEGIDVSNRMGAPAEYLGLVATVEPPAARVDTGGLRGARGGEAANLVTRSIFGRGLPDGVGERYGAVLQPRVEPPLWVSTTYRGEVLATRLVEGDEEDLVFTVDLEGLARLHGSVRVRVVAGDSGEPVTEGIELTFPLGGERFAARVDGDVLVFEDVVPGWIQLVSRPELTELGWEPVERSVDVPAAGVVDLGTVVLERRADAASDAGDASNVGADTGSNGGGR